MHTCRCENGCVRLTKWPVEWGFEPFCSGEPIVLGVWMWIKKRGCASYQKKVYTKEEWLEKQRKERPEQAEQVEQERTKIEAIYEDNHAIYIWKHDKENKGCMFE